MANTSITSPTLRSLYLSKPMPHSSEVKAGFECGIGFDKFNDLKVGDVIEVFAMERVLTPA